MEGAETFKIKIKMHDQSEVEVGGVTETMEVSALKGLVAGATGVAAD